MVPNVKFEVLNVIITAFRRWRQHATPRCWQISMRLHGTTPQKRTVTAVRTSNIALWYYIPVVPLWKPVYISPLTIQWNNTYLYTALSVDNQTTNWNSKW